MTDIAEVKTPESGMTDEAVKRNIIITGLVGILEDMIEDWDIDLDDPIGTNTQLIADIGFESIDVVQFITAIEELFHCRSIPFEKLVMEDGRYVDEFTIGNVVTFLEDHLEL